MIRCFKDRKAKAVYEGRAPKGFPADLVAVARRRMGYLDAAKELDDLKQPPGNGLHALKDDRASQHAIKVNDQFRLAFTWGAEGPEDVEFVDYH